MSAAVNRSKIGDEVLETFLFNFLKKTKEL